MSKGVLSAQVAPKRKVLDLEQEAIAATSQLKEGREKVARDITATNCGTVA
jgi:hypothetical protein